MLRIVKRNPERPAGPERRPLILERRALRRAKVAGVVAVPGTTGGLGVGAIRNLSVGGALIVGDPDVTPAERFDAAIYVAGRAPLHVPARVLRRRLAHAGEWALKFDDLDAGTRDAVVRALEQERETAKLPRVVVAVPSVGAPAPLTRALMALRLESRVVRAPLEAAAWVETGAAALLVDERLVEVDGFNLLAFVQRARPDVKRVVLAGEIESFRLNLALRAGVAQAVVEKPFSAELLADRLGLPLPGAIARRQAAD